MENKLTEFFTAFSKCINMNNPRDTITSLADLIKKVINADRCSIFLHDEEKNELYTYYAHGVDKIIIRTDQGIAGHCFTTGSIINIEDAYNDPRFDREWDRRHGYRTKSLLAVPLKTPQGKIIGVFEALNKKGASAFTKEDILLIENICLYSASILEGMQLYEMLKRTQKEIIIRLSNATKYKDKETRNHIIRVGLYTEIMAKTLGWSDEEAELIRLAAPMHDIGKVGIPDAILQKPGRLNEEEWEKMKKHTIYGYEILKGSDSRLLQIAAIVALEHHERWDGTGYPHGKKGEEISIYGRLTAIADVFDALTSDRPYKKAWPPERAREEIKNCSGTFFDPKLVEIFLDRFDDILKIKELYKDEMEAEQKWEE